jgi:tRNA(Ile)-lysidine synthase TilS/MesJ
MVAHKIKPKMIGWFDLQSTEDAEIEALSFLRSNLSANSEIFVGFSGGKDSICVAKLMELSGLKYRLFHSFTGIDPPEVTEFIKREYPGCVFLHPKKTFDTRNVFKCS